MRARAVRPEVVAALDDWASITADHRRRAWLLAVARSADPDGVRIDCGNPSCGWTLPVSRVVAKELRVDELSPQLAIALGRVSRQSGGEAVALLTATQKRFPEDFRVNFELAWQLNQQGRWNEALGYFRTALALRPDSSAAYNGLGEVLRSMGRVDEAIEPLEHALRLDPRNMLAHYNLGLAFHSTGRPDEAIDHYKRALSIDPEAGALHNNIGMALKARGRLDEAIQHLRESVRINPNSTYGQVNLGHALHEKGREDEALSHVQESVHLDPKNRPAQGDLAFLLREGPAGRSHRPP